MIDSGDLPKPADFESRIGWKAQFQQLIESVRNSAENPQEPRVILYRAITGPLRNVDGKSMNEGPDDDDLIEFGIFNGNGSSGQSFRKLYIGSGYYDADPSVPGLPVFATLNETLDWLKGKEFSAKPAIAALDLPLSVISGSDRLAILMRNTHGAAEDNWGDSLSGGSDRLVVVTQNPYGGQLVDWEVPYARLLQHSKTGHVISGECYLRGTNPSDVSVPEEIRKYEVLIRPRALSSKGLVMLESGFEVFSPPPVK